MSDRSYDSRRKPRASNSSVILISVLTGFLLILVVFSLVIRSLSGTAPAPAAEPETKVTEPETKVTEPETKKPSLLDWLFGSDEKETEPATEPTEPFHLVSTASIGATGDILMHMPVIKSGARDGGGYDFSDIFRDLAPYTTQLDYAVANLETTLCGTDNGFPYSGYPQFNCPDEIVDAARNAGFDMLLTANNHCYDTGEKGYLRTIRTVRSKGLDSLGGVLTEDEPNYLLKDLNGIRVGMYCATYIDPTPSGGDNTRTYLNGIPIAAGSEQLINTFDPENTSAFLSRTQTAVEAMKDQGAEAIVIFMHWGTEYELAAGEVQQNLAQKLCDLGADVIVGGHPHVVQPMALLTSHIDPDHHTVCLYSMGNAVSNQRRFEMNLNTGHTEDGVLFTFTFAKYSDGSVVLDSVDLLPLWVNGVRPDGKTAMDKQSTLSEYRILPLDMDTVVQWSGLYDLDADSTEMAVKSYERTSAIVGTGLTKAKEFLAQQNALLTGAAEEAQDAA